MLAIESEFYMIMISLFSSSNSSPSANLVTLPESVSTGVLKYGLCSSLGSFGIVIDRPRLKELDRTVVSELYVSALSRPE